jgi:long-chain fatty acid transport protein
MGVVIILRPSGIPAADDREKKVWHLHDMETRMGMIRSITGILLVLVLLSSGVLASGFETAGLGAKARGMGGAFRAVADDWTAAYYNPAGYAFILDNQIGGQSGFIHFRHELTPDYRYWDSYGSAYETGVYNDRVLYNRHKVHAMPSGGFVARLPIWGETVFGLSIYQPFDNNLTWVVYEPLLAYNDEAAEILPGDHIVNDLNVLAFQLTAAREFSEDQLSVGIGVQLLRTDMFLRNLYFRANPMPTPLNDRPFDKIAEFGTNEGSGWGVGFRGGLLWKFNEDLKVALTGALPLDITVEGDANLAYIMPKMDTVTSGFNEGQVEYLFTSGKRVELNSDFEADLKLPASFGLGLAYQMSEKLLLSLDAEYVLWSQFEGFQFAYSNFGDLPPLVAGNTALSNFLKADLSSPVEWEDAGKVMLGAAYDFNDKLTFLGGVSLDQSPTRSSSEITPLFVDLGTKYGFSGGLLYNTDRWQLGLITAYVHTPDDRTVSTLVDLDSNGIDDNFPGLYSAQTYETLLSVNYRF